MTITDDPLSGISGGCYTEEEYATILASLPEDASDEDWQKLAVYCDVAKVSSVRVKMLLSGDYDVIGFNDDNSPRLEKVR